MLHFFMWGLFWGMEEQLRIIRAAMTASGVDQEDSSEQTEILCKAIHDAILLIDEDLPSCFDHETTWALSQWLRRHALEWIAS